MNKAYQERVCAYRTALSVVKKLLDDGSITKADYNKLERMLLEKYGLDKNSIFR